MGLRRETEIHVSWRVLRESNGARGALMNETDAIGASHWKDSVSSFARSAMLLLFTSISAANEVKLTNEI